MIAQECYRCGKQLEPGSLKYIVKIIVMSDFDGIIEGPGDKNMEEEVNQILEEIENWPAEELEKDVLQETSLILCKACKEYFMLNPCGIQDRPVLHNKYSGMIH